MRRFLFVPDVDDSLPPLKAGQWAWLTVSFLVSLALLALFILTISSHILFALLAVFVLPAVAMPMQAYAMSRRGRLVGKLFLACAVGVLGIGIYSNRTAIYYLGNAHTVELPIIGLIAASVYWITHCIDQAGNLILKRLDVLQRRVNSVESKLDRIGRSLKRD
jgi:hypothetical protein